MTNYSLQIVYWILLETQLGGNQVKIDPPVVMQPGAKSNESQIRF